MKHILLPTDFSENAYNAIYYAVQLYKDVPCRFYILHTYNPINISTGGMLDTYATPDLQNIEKQTAERKLKEIEDSLYDEFNNTNHTFITMASFNLLIAEMKIVIKENDIDLVIMGTKGATGAKEIFIGTNTMYAIKKLRFPVIAVPSGYTYEQPSDVLLPTDYKFSKSNKYISLIRELCEVHTAKLHILNVYNHSALKEKQQETESFLDAFFADIVCLFHLAEEQELIKAIETSEKKYKINFLVMIHNKHNFFENLLFKPIIDQMVYHTNVPFLVIPSEAQ
ncbi:MULTISPECIES: universal stress protein [unclassified Polaribacter]|uniref:universal stress protein n=1 Tax=unclassified Polaribacter TaxID=196858 RepID=UPI0011BED424|nr:MULTISPECIES: universal stress protein [unclassified Polaribacter]TXD51986.1 universal stress protein [Polaribacter sp. IC063]TXD58655.1 universal stress protein [Polaribacter sp. IC066]